LKGLTEWQPAALYASDALGPLSNLRRIPENNASVARAANPTLMGSLKIMVDEDALDFSVSLPNLSILISRRRSSPSTKIYVKTRFVLSMEAIPKLKHPPRRISILGSLPGVQSLVP
jgi:hypothetical protein